MRFDQDGWLDAAKEYDISGNSWDRGGISPTHLVVHGTAGGSDGSGTMAYMGNNGVSTHFALSTNGDIWQGVPCSRAAWGNSPLKAPLINFAHAELNPNLWTISIEFCKPDTTNQINITDAQKQSGFALIQIICDTYNIPKKQGDGDGGIVRHADINSIDRARCPGPFPFDELYVFLGHPQQEQPLTIDITNPTVANFFTQLDAQHWQCKSNGFIVQFAILNFYKKYGGDALCGLTYLGLPTSGEINLGNGAAKQVFERGIAVYDPQKKIDNPPSSGVVYLMHIDQITLQKQLDTVNAKLVQIKQIASS